MDINLFIFLVMQSLQKWQSDIANVNNKVANVDNVLLRNNYQFHQHIQVKIWLRLGISTKVLLFLSLIWIQPNMGLKYLLAIIVGYHNFVASVLDLDSAKYGTKLPPWHYCGSP